MKAGSDDAPADPVFRDQIKEHRGAYYVGYQPADVRFRFATVQLTFHGDRYDPAAVAAAMEQELDRWLNRFPVPAMISSFDAKENSIRLSADSTASLLMGYLDPLTKQTIKRWGGFELDQLPAEQLDPEFLWRVYQDVPYRRQKHVQDRVRREARRTGRAIRTFVLLVAVIPVLIEVVGLGVAWLGHLLATVSICTGIYKCAKTLGWIKPSKRATEEAEKQAKMAHYYYHCERNPAGFARLRAESFDRESIEKTRREAEELKKGCEPKQLKDSQADSSVSK